MLKKMRGAVLSWIPLFAMETTKCVLLIPSFSLHKSTLSPKMICQHSLITHGHSLPLAAQLHQGIEIMVTMYISDAARCFISL